MRKPRTETVTFACGHTGTFRPDGRKVGRNMPNAWGWKLREGLPCDKCERKPIERRIRAMSREELLAGVLRLRTDVLKQIFKELTGDDDPR